MSSATFMQTPPIRLTPLMGFMEASIRPPARDEDPEVKGLLSAACCVTTWDSLVNAGGNGGNFIHMARNPELLGHALRVIQSTGKTVKDMMNISNGKGHSAYDLAWSSSRLRSWLSIGKAAPRNVWPRIRAKPGKAGAEVHQAVSDQIIP